MKPFARKRDVSAAGRAAGGQVYARGPLVYLAVAAALAAGCRNDDKDRDKDAVRDGSRTPKRGLEAVFALDDIPSLHITLDERAVKKLTKKPKKIVRGTFAWGDLEPTEAGIRLKGNRSMRKLDGKSAFKVRFDKYDPDGRFLGQASITLNNMVEDPTMMREILGYRVMRAMGVPAPEVGYANVTVNGARFGLYAVIETADERFLAKHFADPTGNLYEGEYGCDLFPEDVDGFDKDAGEGSSREDLAALAAAAWPAEGAVDRLFYAPDARFDRERFLAFLAVSAFIGDFDGYRHAHNYRIYHEPARDKWTYLPWGYDRVLRKGLDIYDSEGLTAKRCFADPRCRLDYVRTLGKVADTFASLELDQAVAALAKLLDASVKDDPRRPYKRSKMRAERIKLRKFISERPAQVREQLSCVGPDGREVDADGDGHGCTDCDDANPAVHPGAPEACNGVDDDCTGLADDAPACPCPTVVIEGATFALCDLPMPWVEAAAFCEAQGATLARIDSAEQARELRRAASEESKDRWWIGLTDRGQEGTFRWHDGAPVSFTYWSKGEPDTDGCSQNCVVLKEKRKGRKAKGTWNDTHCGQHRPFVCRLP